MVRVIVVAGFAFATFASEASAPAPVVFDTPAADEKGVMFLGNGEVGATAWLDAAGTLHTVLQNSDSWNEGGRHVKTGAIDYATGCAVDAGTYRQELSMERGEFEVSWKSGGNPVTVRYRIQHGTDSIAVCDVHGAPDVEAKVVNWRLYPGGTKEFGVGEYGLGIRFCEGQFQKNVENMKFTINADRLVPGGWCHVNRNETVAELMKVYDYYQATGDLGKPDLLSDRVFGGVTRRLGGRVSSRADAAAEDSLPPRILFLSAVTCLHPCKDESEWLRRTNEMLDRDGWTLDGEEAKRSEHIAAWAKFWDRSHIVVSPAAGAAGKRRTSTFPANKKLPVRFGVNPKGGDKFLGTFVSAEVEFDGNKVYSGVPKVGDTIGWASCVSRAGDPFRFSCRFTTPAAESPQRLIDNITPGKGDGFLVDLLKGHVRMIVGKRTFTHKAKVPSDREVSVEAVVPQTGPARIVVDGKCETFDFGERTVAEACAAVTRAYAAQRYTTACAGRGRLPIRFNGSIFTVSHEGDPDYRRWGSGYWWQNTRLPYYPMFAAGDLDMLQPLFKMYLGFFDFNLKRTRKYLGHGGAYFPECVQPWGDHFMGSYGPECAWKDRKDKLQHHPCHKYEWVGQLEMSLMLLDYQAYTQDTAWFRKHALPSIREYVRYFDAHYKLDEKGRYHMYPAQAVETWQDCTNPMTEVAGITRITDLLLALPDSALEPGDRELFAKIRSRVPELPTRKLEDGGVVFAPGEKFTRHRNVETPELYCVFPFRLCSFEKPNAEIGLRTYPVRFHKHYRGWAQDELNAAYLGLADEAAEHLVPRVLYNSASGFRWPAYWGPNFDWHPDQCAGGNIQNTLQSMLMQYEGKKIFLMPAWPKDWNCDFKLHAPCNTTVEGRVENGQLKDLVVTPASRRSDVVVCGTESPDAVDAGVGWRLKWSDEFNGTQLDTNVWQRCAAGGSDWNRHMSERPDLVTVGGGYVTMRGVRNDGADKAKHPWLTGGIVNKSGPAISHMAHGKVLIRVKFQDHQKGAWPALWMCGVNPDAQGRRWPWNGEIDIVERLNGDPFVYHTVHSGWTLNKKHPNEPKHGGKGRIRNGEWNVYGFELSPTALIWSVNGVETFRYHKTDCGDPDQWPFDSPFYFLLDMQLGGKWVGKVNLDTLPVEMYIDYIRLYETGDK